jgi:hypothetical protein
MNGAAPDRCPLHQAVSISLLSTVVLVALLVVLVTLNCPLLFMFGQNADEDGVCVVSYLKRQEHESSQFSPRDGEDRTLTQIYV